MEHQNTIPLTIVSLVCDNCERPLLLQRLGPLRGSAYTHLLVQDNEACSNPRFQGRSVE